MKQYFAAGARVVWIVYPEQREIEVWRDSGPIVLGENENLTAPDLLPEFSVSVNALFWE